MVGAGMRLWGKLPFSAEKAVPGAAGRDRGRAPLRGHWEGELVHTKRDGAMAVVASRWALERDEHGQPSAILEINSDITEHKQLELREHEARHHLHTALKALRESEARFKRLAEVKVIGVGVADLSGNILEANEAFLQMVGYTQEDLLWGDLHVDEITPPEYRPPDERAVEQSQRSGVCIPYEKEFIRKDGSRVPVLVGAVFSGEGQDSAIVLVSRPRWTRAGWRDLARRPGERIPGTSRSLRGSSGRPYGGITSDVGRPGGAGGCRPGRRYEPTTVE